MYVKAKSRLKLPSSTVQSVVKQTTPGSVDYYHNNNHLKL